MAQTIKLKRGTTTPTTSDIVSGEVAIDTSAQKLYVNDSGTIKEVGGGGSGIQNVVEDTTPQLGGNLDFNGSIATSFTSTGIDDNATSTAITIDSSQNVSLSGDVTVNGNITFDNTNDSNYDVTLGSYYDYDGWFRLTDGGGAVRFSVGRDNHAYVGGAGTAGNKLWDEGDFTSTNISNWNTAYADTSAATNTSTASTLVKRDASGDFSGRYIYSSYVNMSHGVGTRSSDTIFYSSTDNFLRKTDATGFRSSLNVPTRTGGDASGTWGISITGNAATATWADTVDVNSGQTSQNTWYSVVWHSGDTVYSTPTVRIYPSIGGMDADRYYIGNAYLDAPAGNYGSMNITGAVGSSGTYSGYAVNDRLVLMNNGGTTSGLYNDNDNEWFIRCVENAGTFLYYNGGTQLETANGYTLINNQARSPIFYDSADTGYYADLASTSRMNKLMLTGTANIGDAPVASLQSSSAFLDLYCNTTGGGGLRLHDNQGVRAVTVYQDGGGKGGFLDNDGHWAVLIQTGTSYLRLSCDNNDEFRVYTSYTYSVGSSRSPVFYDVNNTSYYAHLDSTGDSIRAAGNIVAYYSDERLKDIEGNIPNALDKVCSLNGFYYRANEKAQKLGYKDDLQVGLSAQEVQKVLPEIIKDCPADANYMTLDYAKTVPLLVEAIKELKAEIEELKAR